MEKRTLHAIWASVAVVFVITAAGVSLALAGKDPAVIIAIMGALAVPLIGVFGAMIYQKLSQVQSTSNGNLSYMLEQQRKNQEEFLQIIRELHPGLKSPDSDVTG